MQLEVYNTASTSTARVSFPSPFTFGTEGIQKIAQAILTVRTWEESLTFYVADTLSKHFVVQSGLVWAYFVPSFLFQDIFGKDESGKRKAAWCLALAGITSSTLIAYTAYHFSSSITWSAFNLSWSAVAKGTIVGIHSFSLRFFACSPYSAKHWGMLSLRQGLEELCIVDVYKAKNYPPLEADKYKTCEKISVIIASIGCLAANIALTYGLKNPILADTASYTLFSVINTAALRLLLDDAHRKAHIPTSEK